MIANAVRGPAGAVSNEDALTMSTLFSLHSDLAHHFSFESTARWVQGRTTWRRMPHGVSHTEPLKDRSDRASVFNPSSQFRASLCTARRRARSQSEAESGYGRKALGPHRRNHSFYESGMPYFHVPMQKNWLVPDKRMIKARRVGIGFDRSHQRLQHYPGEEH